MEQRRNYNLADGTKAPGVTTIIGYRKPVGGLMHWAWEQGRAGKDYRESQKDAADAGTIAHRLVERWLKKEEHPTMEEMNTTPETWQWAREAFNMFLEWVRGSCIADKIIETEVMCISERLRVGGTIDAVIEDGEDAFQIVDWKTSNAVYEDYLIQIAAYGALYEERTNKRCTGYHLCKFSKQDAHFSHHFWKRLNEGLRAFVLMREQFDILYKLSKMAR